MKCFSIFVGIQNIGQWFVMWEHLLLSISKVISNRISHKCKLKVILIWVSCLCFSSWGSSKAGGGGGSKLHGSEGDVALPHPREAARSDPWLPGSLCTRGKWRVTGPAPHQGRHAGWCPGMTISLFPQHPFFRLGGNDNVFYLHNPDVLLRMESFVAHMTSVCCVSRLKGVKICWI